MFHRNTSFNYGGKLGLELLIYFMKEMRVHKFHEKNAYKDKLVNLKFIYKESFHGIIC